MKRVKGLDTNKLVIFDLDDTLVKTDAKVKILDRKTREVIRELTPDEFNSFAQKRSHVLDFEDFDCPQLLRQGQMIHEIFELLKSSYYSKIPVAILTARSSSELVRDFFLQNGIDIHPELVIAINDPQFPFKGSIAERKKEAIKDLIDSGYTDLTFFDDNEDNLRLAKEAEGYKEATIRTIRVD